MAAFIIFLVIVMLSEIMRHLFLDKMKFTCQNPDCGYDGYAKGKEKGSLAMFSFLMILGAIPNVYAAIVEKESLLLLITGIIPVSVYYIFKGEIYYICPKCRIKLQEEQA